MLTEREVRLNAIQDAVEGCFYPMDYPEHLQAAYADEHRKFFDRIKQQGR
jgi:hypothetical protein